MARTRITKKKLTAAKEAILHDGSFFEKEASQLGISKNDLMERLAAIYDGGKKNTQYKAVVCNSNKNAALIPEDELKKLQAMTAAATTPKAKKATRGKKAAASTNPAIVKSNDSTEVKEESLAEQKPSDSAEEITEIAEMLQEKKAELEKQLVAVENAERTAKEVLQVRAQTLEKAKEVFEKAKLAMEKAEEDLYQAELERERTEAEASDVRSALTKVEEGLEVERNKVYLVAPWYSGKWPSLGTFISSEELDRCVYQDVPEEYLPDMSVEGILKFDYVPDYKKARKFVGLVTMFELQGKKYKALITDNRVKELVEENL